MPIMNLKIHPKTSLVFTKSKQIEPNVQDVDFNGLYAKYCNEYFGSRNGAEMFEKLKERMTFFWNLTLSIE